MNYTQEFDIETFPFHSGAKEKIEAATQHEKDAVAAEIKLVFADRTPTKSEINDFVWFSCDDIFDACDEATRLYHERYHDDEDYDSDFKFVTPKYAIDFLSVNGGV